MNCSVPSFPVPRYLPEFAQTHVHWVSDATQPSHPLSSPSPLTLSLSQHQGLFQWVSSSHRVPKVLEFQIQHWIFQWIFRVDFLIKTGWSCSPRDLQESFPVTQLECIKSSVLSILYVSTLTTSGKTIALIIWIFVGKVMCLIFNTLSRFVIAFYPRIKRLLISWLQSPSAAIL